MIEGLLIFSGCLALLSLAYGYHMHRRVHAKQLELKDLQSQYQDQSFTLQELQIRQEKLPELETENRTLQESLKEERFKLNRLETQWQEAEKHWQEKISLLENAEKRLQETFKAASQDVLHLNNKSFLELAKSTLEKYQKQAEMSLENKEKSIHEMLTPLQKTLGGMDTKLQDLEKARVGAYEAIKQQVGDLLTSQKELRGETANLVKALRTPNIRGRWGEMQLKRVVEVTGLSQHCDFIEQVHMTTDEGQALRPDMVVRLPGGKTIIIDAKAPMSAYLDALETDDESKRKELIKDHARQIRAHIQSLSSRNYWDQFKQEDSPEFVVLFLPSETFFSAALEADPSLIEQGVEKKVILTTPATLIALLHAVAYGWRQEKLAENAQVISQLGKDLYKRLSDMGTHMSKLGRDLNTAVKSYNSTVGTMERRILPAARPIQRIGNILLPGRNRTPHPT